MSIPTHVHITEREGDGTWEDCTWCSGLEFYRDAFDSSKPATHAEAEALRAASGEPPTGGSNLGDLRRGIKARYGADLPPAINNASILAYLKEGYCSVLQGSMVAFPSTSHLSVWDPSFDGGHAVYLARVDGVLLWCDPEAPLGANVPVAVTPAEVTAFVKAFPGQAIVAPIKQAKEAVIMSIATRGLTLTTDYAVNLPAGTGVVDAPGGTLIGNFTGPVDYFGTSGPLKAVRVPTPDGSVIGYTSTAATPYKKAVAPPVVDTSPFTQADLDKAVAAEKARLRGLLGL